MMMISFPFFSSSLQILNGIDRRRTVGMGVGRKRRVTSLFLFFFLTCSRHFGTFTAVGQCEIFAVFLFFFCLTFFGWWAHFSSATLAEQFCNIRMSARSFLCICGQEGEIIRDAHCHRTYIQRPFTRLRLPPLYLCVHVYEQTHRYCG